MKSFRRVSLAVAVLLAVTPMRTSAQGVGNISGSLLFNGSVVQGNGISTLYVNIPGAGGSYINTSGGYSFSAIVAGSYTPTVYDNGCSLSSILGQGGPFTVAGGSTTTANIDLAATAGRVQGTVYLNGVGTTSNITVNGLCGQWQTAADGTFVHYLAPGSYTASVNNSSGGSIGTFSFTVTAGQTTNAGNVSVQSGAVSGTVLWNGAAVSGTAVTTMLASIPNVGSSNVSSAGTYSLTGVAPGSSYNVTLYGNSCSPAITFGSVAASATGGNTTTANIDITAATGRVSGSITVNGATLASPQISISGACQQWQTQSNGAFLQYLLPGNYTATVAGASGTIGTFSFTITAGQATNVGAINFTTGNLTTIPTFNGAAISSPNLAKLYAFVNSSPVTGSPLDPTQADFIFNTLSPSGSYTVGIYQNNCSAAAGQLATTTGSVTGGSTTTLRVDLASGAGLVVGTATSNGSALANPQISISGLCGTWASKADGTYFQYLPPGTYSAQVMGPSGAALGTFTFTIVAGQTTTANFVAGSSSSTTTSLSSSANPATVGQAVTLTAVVSGSHSPAGPMSFYDGNALLAVVQPSGGQWAYTTTSLALGKHALSTVYGGDSNNATSASPTLLQNVAAVQPPTVTGVTPNYGPLAGGTAVTITGTNFTSAATVSFGSTAATGVVVNSATSITATSPAGTGVVDVTVTTPGGTTATSTADRFSYVGTYTVTVNTDTTTGVAANCFAGGTNCSLRDAIAATNAAGFTGTTGAQPTINFSLGQGAHTITLNSPALNPTANVNIAGPGAALLTIAPATTNYTYNAFTSTTNSLAFTLSGVTVTGFGVAGSATGAALYFAPATATAAVADLITLSNDTFASNGGTPGGATASTSGGAVYVGYSTLAVTGSIFTGNSASQGGAIYATSTNVVITGSTFGTQATPNRALTGVGGAVYLNSGLAYTATIGTSTFAYNTSKTNGAGVYAVNLPLTLNTDVFLNNAASGSGGAVYTTGALTVAGSSFNNNTAASNGGAIYVTGLLTVSGSSFTANQAGNTLPTFGGAIYSTSTGANSISNTNFLANRAVTTNISASGGALYAAVANLTNVLFSGNYISSTNNSFGGAAYYTLTANSQLTGVTFTGNSTQTGSTGATNQEGGALYLAGSYVMRLYNSTINGNSAKLGGGVYNSGDGVTNFYNSVTSGNSGSNGYPDYDNANGGGYHTDGNDYVDVAATCSTFCTPLLSALGNYGGGTVGAPGYTTPVQVMLPLPGSPLLAAGSLSYVGAPGTLSGGATTDARGTGYPRTLTEAGSTHVDIGAAEANYSLSFVQQPTDTAVGATVTPAPTVQLLESGAVGGDGVGNDPGSFAGGTLSVVGSPSAASTATVTTTASGLESLSESFTPAATGETLTVTAQSGAATPVTVASATSNTFNVGTVGPVVTAISPTSGSAGGGTVVTITGTGFTGATGVSFGTTAATGVVVNSATSITATSPAGTGAVDVTVMTPNGTSATSAADQFSYLYPPSYMPPTTAVGVTSATQTAYVVFTTSGTLGQINVLTQGAANLDYKFVSGGTCATMTAYMAGQVCTVLYSFTPSRPGQRLGAISLTTGPSSSATVLVTVLLNGTGVGPLATFPGSTTLSSPGSTNGGFVNPVSVAVDGRGDIFVTDVSTNTVKEIVAVNGVVRPSSPVNTVGSGFSAPFGVAVDGSGDIFVADTNNQAVKEIVAVNGVVSSSSTVKVVGSGFTLPVGVTVDGNGDIFISDIGSSSVKEIVAVFGAVSSSSTVNTVGSGFSNPFGVAVDGSGDVFVADAGNNAVKEIVAVNGLVSSSSTVNTVGSGFNNPFGVAVDGSGDVFVVDYGNSAVKEIVAVNGLVSSSSTVNTVGSGFSSPRALVVDGGGHVFVADTGNQAVKEIDLMTAPAQSFASTTVGATSSDSPRSVAVQNAGNAVLTFTSLMTGTTSFPVSGTGTCSTSSSLAASGVCTVAASFTPKSPSALTDTLTLTDNSLNVAGAMQMVALSGTGSGSATVPVVTAISPTSGPTPGGTTVTITGTNFAFATAVSFGGTAATSYIVNSATSITATSPAGTGTVDVTVTTSNGTSATSAADQFTYVSTQTLAKLTVTGYPAFAPTGVAQNVTVTAYDANNNVITGFTGTVTITSSDPAATLPAAYVFTSSDAGVHVFSVTLNTAGTQSITATSGSISGSETGIVSTGYIVAISATNQTLSKFTENGAALNGGTMGGGGAQSGVAVDAAGDVFSVSMSNGVLVKFNSAGTAVSGSGYGGGGINNPQALAVDGAGQVWVANGGSSLSVFTNNGTAVTPSTGYASGGYSGPSGIAIDISGNVWVTNLNGGNVIEVLGGAAPAAPLSTALTNGTTGVRP